MKKIIIGILSFALFFTASNTFATSIWNGSSNDCPTVAVANFTKNIGYNNPCWPLSSVNANPGDSVNVRIYYHNTSFQNATNVRIILNTPTITSASQSFSGQIISDQGSVSFGPVTINLPESEKLTFGSTRWYPNQTQTAASFFYGQDGSELINGGLQIGTITPSWSSQGSIVASFYVNKPNPTGTIKANINSCLIQAGNGTCPIGFSWNTINPIGISTIVDNNGTVIETSNNGAKPFYIHYGNSIYKLFNNNKELDSASVSASCVSGTTWDTTSSTCMLPVRDCEINNFTASSTDVASGSPVTLSWTTNYCKSITISGVGTPLSVNGSVTVYPTNTTTYTLTGFGNTSVSPTKAITIIAGGPVFAPGFPAGAPGYQAINK